MCSDWHCDKEWHLPPGPLNMVLYITRTGPEALRMRPADLGILQADIPAVLSLPADAERRQIGQSARLELPRSGPPWAAWAM